MKTNISIGIVTFRQRAHLIKDLIKQIRSHVPEEVDILLAVNGNNEENMPNDYREDMLKLSLEYKNVFPIVCPEFKSLCKLWNTLVIFSKTDYNFIICDDVVYENSSILDQVTDFIDKSKSGFFTINNQFSHFVLTKTMLHNLGYFDERLSGFGEEDGDIIHRYIEAFGQRMPDIQIKGLYNKGSYELRNEKIETHIDNKPRFNREFVMKKYTHDPNGIYGMSPIPVRKVIEDYQQYPHEMFVINNKHNIAKFDKIIFDEQH
jgi:hypothetical protein